MSMDLTSRLRNHVTLCYLFESWDKLPPLPPLLYELSHDQFPKETLFSFVRHQIDNQPIPSVKKGDPRQNCKSLSYMDLGTKN